MASSVSGLRGRIVGIVAGEASGDLLGAELIRAMRREAADLEFVGIGGPRMEAAGMQILFPLEKLAVRGYVEVLRHYRGILAIRRELRRKMLDLRPAVFVGIDAPDFNLDLEVALRTRGIPTVHYVSPSIWAWRGERIHKIKRAVSKMLTVFPFEAPLYERAGIDVEFVGHPIAEMVEAVPAKPAAREQLRLPATAPVIALLPGSRQSEVTHLANTYVRTAQQIYLRHPDARFLVPLASRETREIFETAIYANNAFDVPLAILFGHAHEALAAADVALIASGTATLEAALLRCPMVITYRMPSLSYRIMRCKKYLPYVGLPNILAGEFIVPEILQDDAIPENLSQALLNLLGDAQVRARLDARFAAMHASLRLNAAQRAARAIVPLMQR